MKKKIVIISSIVATVLIIGGILGYFLYLKPHNEAVKKYNAAVSVIKNKNAELDEEISKLQRLIDSKDKPLDETLIDSSKETIKKASAEKTVLSKMPFKTSEIIKQTEKYSVGVNYSENIGLLKEKQTALETSQKQYKQFICPSEEFVLQRVLSVDEVTAAKPVTEDNDPNGKLNKAGGYTATVFLESKNINKDEYGLGNDVIENGTEGGGAVEVYANGEDAKARNDYLAGFDGAGFFDSGSHTVIGTTVIRTSTNLTATQQKELQEKIIDALARLE